MSILTITYKWFHDNLEILSLNRFIPSLITLMSTNKDLFDFANKLFKEIGTRDRRYRYLFTRCK